MAAKTETHIALVGMNYTTAKGEVRVEAGEACPDLPAKSVGWLKSQGFIQAKTKAAPVESDTTVEESDD